MIEKEQIKRGKALLDAIHDLINDEMNAMDMDVDFAIRRVGRDMAPKGENYLAAGADLAEFLISDKPICRGTRLVLAALVLGELRRPPAKPHISASHPKVLEAVGRDDLRIYEGWPVEAASHDVNQRLGVPRTTLADYIWLVREREGAIAGGKKAPSYPKQHFLDPTRFVLTLDEMC